MVDALGAPHVGERSERELIAAFVNKIAELKPQLVTFNGSSFDLPVLRYRAMVHKLSAAGLSARPYFHRYTDDAVGPVRRVGIVYVRRQGDLKFAEVTDDAAAFSPRPSSRITTS